LHPVSSFAEETECKFLWLAILFRKHMENFSRAGLSGPGELAWEQAAWQAGQAAAFAQLFLEAQQSAQAHHPGIYFQLAANYAISRSFLLTSVSGSAFI
jgi:hypothetical protein